MGSPITEWGKHKGIAHYIKNENPEKKGATVAQIINLLLDNEVGEKRSEIIQDRLESWIVKFAGALIKELRRI